MLNGSVRRCKTGVVTAGREQLLHCGTRQIADRNLIQKTNVLTEFWLLLDVTEYGFIDERVAVAGVNIFCAGNEQEDSSQKKGAHEMEALAILFNLMI